MEEKVSTEKPKPHWFISLAWYQPNNRSFAEVAKGSLCAQCRRKLEAMDKELSPVELIANIKDCCAKRPEFITPLQPILESMFRLFLANGNEPLDLESLGKQLSERRGGDTARTSPEILSRLLQNERYYGIRQASGQ